MISAAHGEIATLRRLADYLIETHFPKLGLPVPDAPAVRFRRRASMVRPARSQQHEQYSFCTDLCGSVALARDYRGLKAALTGIFPALVTRLETRNTYWETVSGGEAVEIVLASGKCLRLETDEPRKLAQAILAAAARGRETRSRLARNRSRPYPAQHSR